MQITENFKYLCHLHFKSLMYKRMKRGPRIEPCGTSADIEPHFHALLFKTARRFLLSRKL